MQSTPQSFDSDELMSALVESAPNGVVMIDASGAIALVNAELERMFGYSRAALLGQPIETLLPERFRTSHVGMRSSFVADPQRRPMGAGRELFGLRADGTEFALEIGLSGIQSASGRLAVATVVDISARKDAEEAFRNIVEAAPHGMVMVNAAGKIIMANAQMTKLFGYTREELLGRPIDSLVPARHRAAHASQRIGYERAPSLRAMGANRDLTGEHKDGTELAVEIGLSPVVWNGSTVSLAVVTDISARKKLELELREANAHLEEFTYVASHDLRSPLRGIGDLVEWLIEELQPSGSPDALRNLDRIQTRVKRLECIIEDLLAYARARDASTDLVTIVPHELFNGLIEVEAPPPGFVVAIEIAAAPFKAARTPLETVLRNLLSNAIKHHDRDQGRVTLRMSDDDSYCHIEVSDDGPGIPSQAQRRVFRLFQTVSSAKRGGSGIGLALTQRLVEAHGGKIKLVSSDDTRGSTFHVWWPRFAQRSPND